MNTPQQQPQPPIVPGNFPTLRASDIAVHFDGGSFTMNVVENRPAPVN